MTQTVYIDPKIYKGSFFIPEPILDIFKNSKMCISFACLFIDRIGFMKYANIFCSSFSHRFGIRRKKKSFQLLCAPMKWIFDFPFCNGVVCKEMWSFITRFIVIRYPHKCNKRSIFGGDYHVQSSMYSSYHFTLDNLFNGSISQLSHLFNHRIG